MATENLAGPYWEFVNVNVNVKVNGCGRVVFVALEELEGKEMMG